MEETTISPKSAIGNSRTPLLLKAIKFGLGAYWYGMIVILSITLLFLLFAGAMTKQRFPFPSVLPVTISFTSMDSIKSEMAARGDRSVTKSDETAGGQSEAVKNDLNDGLNEMAFKPMVINGDLIVPVPMKTLWPYLFVGYFTPGLITLAILFCLRRIFKMVTSGRPFEPANLRYVKIIGWLVLLLAPLNALGEYWTSTSLLPRVADLGHTVETSFSLDYQQMFIGLIILALAHIFAIGRRLQQDQDLTI